MEERWGHNPEVCNFPTEYSHNSGIVSDCVLVAI